MLPRARALAAPLALLAPLAPLSACASPMGAGPVGASATSTASAWTVYRGGASPSPDGSFAADLVAAGTFQAYRPGSTAITYDPKVVPPGSSARVEIGAAVGVLRIRLTVAGMVPRRPYGAHLHTMPCTAVADQAGPHYQHRHDPAASPAAGDPAYANPGNEVWLDFAADATGSASATSVQAWTFPPGAAPRSLVVHEGTTRSGPGQAGTAGTRVACLTLPSR